MQKKAAFYIYLSILIFILVGTCSAAPLVKSVEDMSIKSGRAGKFYAVAVGIDQYKDKAVKSVGTAASDAVKIQSILKNKYGFDVTALTNGQATRQNIIDAIKTTTQKATDKDSVLIFFAGQSLIQPDFGYGAWVPVDGKLSDTLSLIDHMQVKNMVRRSKAHHVVIISDSGFNADQLTTGKAPKSAASDENLIVQFMSSSRWVLVSGAGAPTAEKKGKTSYFSNAVISSLKSDSNALFDIASLYNNTRKEMPKSLRGKVALRALKDPKHKNGQFVFINQKKSPAKTNVAVAVPVAAAVAVKKPSVTDTSKPALKKDSTLDISGNISGAQIKIGDQIIGKIPLNNYVIAPGKHTLTVQKSGYDSADKSIVIQDGKSHKLNFVLEKTKPKTGTLTLVIYPSFASLSFDGNTGLSYKPGMDLKAGSYSISASAFGHKSKTVKISVVAGDATKKDIKLIPEKTFTNDIGMNFVWVKQGSFSMGSSPDSPSRGADELLHTVSLNKGFYLQTTEATQSQWKAFVSATGYKTEAESGDGPMVWKGYKWEQDEEFNWSSPGFAQTADHPVTCISYNDVEKFIAWLNSQQKFMTYRLPTEAEWEYAAKAGTNTPFGIGKCLSDKTANYDATSKWENCPVGTARKATTKVASFKPNAWQLFDMQGNVMEWCSDWYGDYVVGENTTDPTGPASGSMRVVRGGGWDSYIYQCRTSNRVSFDPAQSYSNIGFRLSAEFK